MSTTITVTHPFGGVVLVAIAPPPASTIPTLIVPATFRSGEVQATYRNGEQQATYRSGEVQSGGR